MIAHGQGAIQAGFGGVNKGISEVKTHLEGIQSKISESKSDCESLDLFFLDI